MTTPFRWSLDNPRKGVARLVLVGDMTLGARDAMREAFEAAVATPESDVLVDFAAVRLVSSGAIGELVRCQSRLSAVGRRVHMLCPSGDVLETLMVADMHRLLPLHPDLASFLKGQKS
jgi:anti-anti-sigma factor